MLDLKIRKKQIDLLERLTNAVAVSGDEGEVRRIVLEAVRNLADEIQVDAMGNVLVTRRGSAPQRVRAMLAAHMDEVGFMLVADDGDGIYQFRPVGGLDQRHLVGKPVLVGKDHLPGVIGACPIHLTTPDERKRPIPLESLRIDLGPDGHAKPGDRATFATRFRRAGPSIMAKAIDNRIGVATLIELLRNAPENVDLLLAFTVQEEVGLRGARVAAYAFNPDLAIALDSTPANDMPPYDEDDENVAYNTKLGGGPAIYVADRATLADPRLVRWLAETGDAEAIPYQFRQPGGGGTDAGAMHLVREGVPAVSVSVPGRYAHTAVGLARIADWENTLRLLRAALARLTPDLLAGERAGYGLNS
ncbi:MAG: M42 family metallopeptidase [Anaerolineales bacterium]